MPSRFKQTGVQDDGCVRTRCLQLTTVPYNMKRKINVVKQESLCFLGLLKNDTKFFIKKQK